MGGAGRAGWVHRLVRYEGKRKMTPEQKTALSSPCRFAFETAQAKFGTRIRYGATLVLTINNGWE